MRSSISWNGPLLPVFGYDTVLAPITLLCVGTLKTPWAADGCDDYRRRLRGVTLQEISASRERDPVRQKDDEGKRLIDAAKKMRGDLWVLDETGKTMTSPKFSEFLGKAVDHGQPLIFVLGGAYGLSDAVKKAARGSLRLSDMTFPHELCRLVFLEQVYRAGEIRKGTGYHH